MRIKVDQPANSDLRQVTRFLWWPKTIKGELRWLERCTYEQRYVACSYDESFWSDVAWID